MTRSEAQALAGEERLFLGAVGELEAWRIELKVALPTLSSGHPGHNHAKTPYRVYVASRRYVVERGGVVLMEVASRELALEQLERGRSR